MPSCTGNLVNRRPLAPIQAREVRLRIAPEPTEILPNSKEPNFTAALNSECRVNRLMAEAVSNLKYMYDVRSIIKASRGGAAVVEMLDKGQFVFGPQRAIVVNALVAYMYRTVKNELLVSTVMRECLAIRVVETWPVLRMTLYSQEDRPWHHWYHPEQNSGYLENAVATKQKNIKRSGGDGLRKSTGVKKPRKLVEAPVQDENLAESDSEEYTNDVAEAKNLMPSPREKTNILQLMLKTFERRRVHIMLKQVDTVKILSQFPHFLNFGGEVIQQEFNLLYEQKQSCFLTNFVNEMVPKLLKIAENDQKTFGNCISNTRSGTPIFFVHFHVEGLASFIEISYQSFTDVIKAILVLAKMLPTPQRNYVHEATMPLQIDLVDFFNVIPVGTDPTQYVSRRFSESVYKIQPHVLAVGNQQAIRKMYLAVDSKLMEFKNSATPINAIDTLVKSFFVFNLHFPLAWKNVLRFLQLHVYKIPLENPRWSKFSEVESRIRNTQV
ncbi:hypothetical protein KUF71_011194 [Frankliniella fusca]|uniref:Uncharacterized protein n=1 Tax=Frankliniella fusca TaxID=407009 RepID=A0AAE1HIV4_9NEOP|nr:hypothetical protein KUF71_011194 [Frankliniella fusca]